MPVRLLCLLFYFAGICCARAAEEDTLPVEDEPLAVFGPEEIRPENLKLLLGPIHDRTASLEPYLLEIQETVLVSMPGKDIRKASSSSVRIATKDHGKTFLFIRSHDVDQKQLEKQQAADGLEEIERRLTVRSPQEYSEWMRQRLRSRPQVRLTLGAAMIDSSDGAIAKEIGDFAPTVMSSSAARRLCGYSPYHYSPLLTAADFALGHDSLEKSLKTYARHPVRMEIHLDGSQDVTWAICEGHVNRTIHFSASTEMLPTELVDTYAIGSQQNQVIATTRCEWGTTKFGMLALKKVEANFSSPFVPPDHTMHISVSADYTWSIKKKDVDYFRRDMTALVVPFVDQN